MTPRDRVLAAFGHVQPDCTPCDFLTTPEIRAALNAHFGVSDDDALRERLGTDIRYINPPYTGPELARFDDGSFADIWGVIRRPTPNEYGEYDEPVNLPFAQWTSLDEAKAHPWPSPDCYDYDAVPAMCEKNRGWALATGSFGVQDFINGVSFGRGVEQVLLDIATDDPVYLFIVEQRHRFFMEQIERVLKAAKGQIDMVLCGDELGSQRGPLISPATFDRVFAPKKKELFDMVHSYGAKVSHHSCGSTRPLIPRFIGIGMDALQTIQPQAEGMSPYSLKREFAGRIVLHGGVDVQGWLQRATVDQVRREIHRLMDEVGQGGGYILAPCHNIQPDTPVQNVVAMYDAVAQRRKTVA